MTRVADVIVPLFRRMNAAAVPTSHAYVRKSQLELKEGLDLLNKPEEFNLENVRISVQYPRGSVPFRSLRGGIQHDAAVRRLARRSPQASFQLISIPPDYLTGRGTAPAVSTPPRCGAPFGVPSSDAQRGTNGSGARGRGGSDQV
jgi:hypothetical protein